MPDTPPIGSRSAFPGSPGSEGAYGTWTISTSTDGTRFRAAAYQKLQNADDHRVYVNTQNWTNSGYCFTPDYTTCNQEYYHYNTSETTHTTDATYVLKKSSAAVDPASDDARAYVRVKLDIPWRVDPSSGATVTKPIKY